MISIKVNMSPIKVGDHCDEHYCFENIFVVDYIIFVIITILIYTNFLNQVKTKKVTPH